MNEAGFFVSLYSKMSTRMLLHFCIKYSICDLFVMSWVAVFWSCNIGKNDVFDKIATEKQKRENMIIKFFLHKSPVKRCFRNGIHSKLMPEEVLASKFGYLYFASQLAVNSCSMRNFCWISNNRSGVSSCPLTSLEQYGSLAIVISVLLKSVR